jgi:N-acetyl-anhydromuramyl-L-alanine amidase AmpD
MDPTKSAGLFYDRLANLDYNNVGRSPGSYAQDIQRSAYPDRYDQRMGEAVSIYQRLTAGAPAPDAPAAPDVPRPQFEEREMFGEAGSQRSRKPINFFIHTEEGPPGHEITDHSAEWLAQFCQGQNGVSYHYTVRDGIVYDVVDTDLYSWSVLSANVFSINLCFAGSSVKLSRQQWLEKYGRDIEIAAYLAVQDARKYGFSTEVIVPPYSGNPRPGISDHKYVTQKLGIGNHTDVGGNFPWDVFAGHVNRYTTGEDELSAEAEQIIRDLRDAQYDSISMYAAGPQQACSQAEAYAWDGRVESSALRGEDWALSLVRQAGDGTLYGVLRNGQPDRFLVEHARAVYREAQPKNESLA